jgi:hypothetical protein
MSSSALSVRPILSHERARFDETLAAQHWLGTGLVGEVMRYVAEEDGNWVALVGCRLPVPRDHPRCQQHGTTSGPHQPAGEMIPAADPACQG